MPSLQRTPINEHSGHPIMRDAFPFLFPTGVGDPKASRKMAIDDNEYFRHFMRWKDGRFAQHPRFRYYLLNSLMRWQAKKLSRWATSFSCPSTQISCSSITGTTASGSIWTRS